MSFNFEALEQALGAVEAVGKGEKTFPVGDTEVTLRILLPHEEVEVQKWASRDMPDEEDGDQYDVMLYFDRFKVGVLSYALCQVGDLDLRDTEFVPTGEMLGNGKEIKIPRHEALRKMVVNWERGTLTGVFIKYTELTRDVGRKAEKAIEFEPSDADSEIERLETRLGELKEEKAEGERASTSAFTEQVGSIAGKPGDAAAPEVPEPEAEVGAQEQEAPPERKSAIPTQAAPPTPTQPATVPLPKAPEAPQRPEESPARRLPPDESLVEASDMEAAVEAENQRLLAARQQAGKVIPPAEGSVLTAAHQAIREAASPGPPPEESGNMSQVGETTAGVPIFRPDNPEMVGTPPATAKPGLDLNPKPEGSKNPRFRPPTT